MRGTLAKQRVQDQRGLYRLFSRGFLIVAPGITIRDRLRVLLPSDADNYYATRHLVPFDMLPEPGKAKIVITNYHAFGRGRRLDTTDVSDEFELDEVYATERQLLYVAATRARERLMISGMKPGSEFLADMAKMPPSDESS